MALEHEDCMDYGEGTCSGLVKFRLSLTGRARVRCDRHQSQHLRQLLASRTATLTTELETVRDDHD